MLAARQVRGSYRCPWTTPAVVGVRHHDVQAVSVCSLPVERVLHGESVPSRPTRWKPAARMARVCGIGECSSGIGDGSGDLVGRPAAWLFVQSTT